MLVALAQASDGATPMFRINRLSRPTALKIAAAITIISFTLGFIAGLPALTRGPGPNGITAEGIPFIAILLGNVPSAAGLVAAFATWRQQRWGIILLIITSVVSALIASPGILIRPSTEAFIVATIGVIESIIVVVLCLWPSPKPDMA